VVFGSAGVVLSSGREQASAFVETSADRCLFPAKNKTIINTTVETEFPEPLWHRTSHARLKYCLLFVGKGECEFIWTAVVFTPALNFRLCFIFFHPAGWPDN